MEHKECRICGKKDKDVELLLGGIIGFAHENCTKPVDRIIDLFIEYIVTNPDGVTYLAEEILKGRRRIYGIPEPLQSSPRKET